MRGWVGVIALGASCTGRPSVQDNGESTTGSTDGNEAVSEGPVSVGDDVDDGLDDATDEANDVDEAGDISSGGASESGGDVPACGNDSRVTPLDVEVWPGQTPTGAVFRELDCEIQQQTTDADGVAFGLDCEMEGGSLVTVLLRVLAVDITIPAGLEWPEVVHVRAYAYRDGPLVDEFPWLRADHFAMYRGDELVLAAGAGGWWPSNAQGELDPDFWAPFRLETGATDCSVKPVECHEAQETALRITLGDEATVGAAYSMVSIGGYDVQVGEMVDSDSTQCEEPTYGWFSFAIAPTP